VPATYKLQQSFRLIPHWALKRYDFVMFVRPELHVYAYNGMRGQLLYSMENDNEHLDRRRTRVYT